MVLVGTASPLAGPLLRLREVDEVLDAFLDEDDFVVDGVFF
jgi:hypothetical protein